MKKQFLLISLVFVILAGSLLSACGNSRKIELDSSFEILSSKSKSANDQVDSNTNNRITNYVGPYVCIKDENTTMFLSAEENDGAGVSIISVDSEGIRTEWQMHGLLDAESMSFSYSDAIKTTEDKTGKRETIYENGTGIFVIKDSETITWENETDKENITFSFNSEEHE